jgi:hypothetical protein
LGKVEDVLQGAGDLVLTLSNGGQGLSGVLILVMLIVPLMLIVPPMLIEGQEGVDALAKCHFFIIMLLRIVKPSSIRP